MTALDGAMETVLATPRLKQFGDSLWIVEGPTVSFYGFPYPTRMVIVRLNDGALWLWSPVALDEPLRLEIQALGEPRYAVEPNKLHHLALAQWVATWPSLRLFAPPGLAKKRPDLLFVGELEDESPPAWRNQIDQIRMEGSFAMTEVLFFHRASLTCLVGDLVQRFDERSIEKTWQRWAMKAGGLTGDEGSTPIEWRLSFIDRQRARAATTRAVGWSPQKLVVAHGACAPNDGARVLRRGMRWLLPKRVKIESKSGGTHSSGCGE